ncbi:DNA mismatch repair protein MutS [Candidatus Halobonum tyrrellensis]|uniref:DNA mismatch repair protein MutS n=1 Tax=Candidatus Halobonum tyrrellensis G22 TaxID=1324957 RepID=V4J0I8_9EURY|nr:DNA mismatch repair protein MutS [Candidatus Halobonum tyrrellensis]ESP88977.1 DNA mismatch repair protein MutS [Candidatus Halobonum tyrrellensis G22]
MSNEAGGIVGEFLSLKASTDADVLAMQCGDFYEFFADDAELVAAELDLKVSQKSSHGSSYPMAGVPLSELTPYLTALVERGYRVAVADQYETADGHAREIERVVSPGTVLDPGDAAARYLAAVERDGDGYGLAFADVTTGRFRAAAVDDVDDVRAELHRFDPVELLPGLGLRDDDAWPAVRDDTDARLTRRDPEAFAPGRARHRLREQFGRETLDAVGLDADAAVAAAGAVLRYVDETGAGVLASMTRLGTLDPGGRVALDATTQRNLELTETMQGERDGTLLSTLDHTETAAGSRLLREWVTRPRRDRAELERRHDAVEALASAALARDRLLDHLDGTADLERLAARATSGSAGPRDLAAVRAALATLPALASAVEGTPLAESPVADALARPDQAAARALHDELDDALVDDPPGSPGEGGVIARGHDDELDELVAEYEEAREWLDGLADREKRRHGLSHVTVDRNKTDGYYVQVGKSAADGVPEHYREIKTLKNSKRFVTDELEERERTVLRLEESRGELERDLFADLRGTVADRAELLQDVGRALAELDALASLAEHAAGNDWTRPDVVAPGEGDLTVDAGRHPVVERTTDFVPNDLRMDDERGFLLVTGPNMSGKSTYMRQCALVVLLAQAGSFVPADAATVPLVDGIYTRVGALDELAQGRSTFMVEMQELSNILHSATDESLVILDEVGRGTATYDGISIAWAATEYLHNEVRARTLFATHYHELTSLADHLPRVANVHVAAEERDGEVTFLRRVRDGPTDRSYGVHVADLAGVPAPVVDRADEVLDRLRAEKAIEARGSDSDAGTKQAVFDLSAGEFVGGADGRESAGPTTTANGTDREERAADANPADDGRAAGGNGEGGGRAATVKPRRAEDTADATLPPDVRAVVSELRSADVNDTSPLELAGRVSEWQRRLESASESTPNADASAEAAAETNADTETDR